MANTIDLKLTCHAVTVHEASRGVTVSIDDAELDDVLGHFDAKDAADHFDHSDLLDQIGIDKVKEHFGL